MTEIKQPNPADPAVTPTSKPKLFIVGGGKGGVGKSFTTQCISAVLVAFGLLPPLVVEFEKTPRTTLYYPDGVHVAVSSQSAAELRRRPALAAQLFDPGFEAIGDAHALGRSALLDLAANLDYPVADYLAALSGESDLGDGEDVLFFAVATGETSSLQDAETAIGFMKQALPRSTCIGVVNDWLVGSPCEPSSPRFAMFEEGVKKRGGAETVHIKALMAEDLLAIAEEQKISLDRLQAMDPGALMKLGLGRNEAIRSRLALIRHLAQWEVILRRHGVIS